MLWILATIAYLQVGYQLGKKSVHTWKKGDSKSLESFLMFPVRHARGNVGEGPLPFMSGVNESSAFYRTLITLFWPLMVAWNGSLVLGLLGPDKVITRLLGKGPSLEERFAELEAENSRVDRTIRRLEAPKRARKPRAKKAAQPAALPAPAPVRADAAPPTFAAPPPPAFVQPPPADEPAPQRSEPVPPPVQVRVTVDVTAPGHATDADADVEPDSAREPEKRAAEHDRIVH